MLRRLGPLLPVVLSARLSGVWQRKGVTVRKLLGALDSLLSFAWFVSPAGCGADGSLDTDRRINVTGGVVVAEGEVVNGPVVSITGRRSSTARSMTTCTWATVGSIFVGRSPGTSSSCTATSSYRHVGGDVIALDGRITTARALE